MKGEGECFQVRIKISDVYIINCIINNYLYIENERERESHAVE
jgi:hypothetical protein